MFRQLRLAYFDDGVDLMFMHTARIRGAIVLSIAEFTWHFTSFASLGASSIDADTSIAALAIVRAHDVVLQAVRAGVHVTELLRIIALLLGVALL